MNFRDTYPFAAFGGKIDPISEIRNAGIVTSGNVFWVKDPSDSDYVEFKDAVGQENLFDTIQAAIDKCTSDQNDYVMVCPKKDGAVWTMAAALDLNEDRVHLISVGYGRTHCGYSNTIEGYAVGTLHDDQLIEVTGKGCEIAGFNFKGTGAATAAAGGTTLGMLYLSGSAHDLWLHDTHFDLMGSAASAWQKMTGGVIRGGSAVEGFLAENVTIHMGTMTAATIPVVTQSAEGKDWTFRDCAFTFTAGDTDHEPFIAGTGDIGLLLFDRCKFVNVNNATAPASLITGEVTDEQGLVLFDYCTAVGITAYGTNAQVYCAPTWPAGTIAVMTNPGIATLGSVGVPAE